MKRFSGLAVLASAAFALLLLPTCRSTKHTVARIVTPAARPTEPYVPPEPTVPPAAPRAASVPSPTPTVVAMPVVTKPPASRYEQSPGVLYEELVPTATAVTPIPSPRSTRVPRPTLTPTRAVSRKPGTYYEDEQGRPIPTATPSSP
ncbi:MAG TPA: hypothetical protein VF999_02040 [Thermoanaerobaculia bacterium]